MGTPLVAVVVTNRSEFDGMRKGLELLRVLGVPFEFEIVSALIPPERVAQWTEEANLRGIEVIVAATSGAPHLPGMLAAATLLPVIGVPLEGSPLRGEESLQGMSQMPPGLPIACVGVNAVENAAILATRILALKYPHFGNVLRHYANNQRRRRESLSLDLRHEFPDLTDPAVTAPPDYRFGLSDLETDPGPAERMEMLASMGRQEMILQKPRVEPPSVEPHEPRPARPNSRVSDEEGRITLDDSEERAQAKKESLPTPPTDKAAGAANGAAEAPPAAESTPETAPGRGKSKKAKPAPAGALPDELPITPTKPKSPLVPSATESAPRRPPRKRPLSDRLFRIDPDNPDVDVIEHAMLTFLEGGIVAMPTDTVYGIAVDATNAEAVERLYRIKGRDRQKAIAILVHNMKLLSRLIMKVPDKIEELTDIYWPGALTIIFPKPVGALAGVSAAPTIGVRIPNHNTTLALISMVARPLATTSANLAGQPPATTVEQVIETLGDQLDCIIDGGPTPGNVASTVLSVVQTPYEILREGVIGRDDLRKVLGGLLAE